MFVPSVASAAPTAKFAGAAAIAVHEPVAPPGDQRPKAEVPPYVAYTLPPRKTAAPPVVTFTSVLASVVHAFVCGSYR